jgi:integrase
VIASDYFDAPAAGSFFKYSGASNTVRTRAFPGARASGKEGAGKPLSPRSVQKVLTLIGTVCRYGKRIGLMTNNPVGDVKKPRAARRSVYVLDVEEIARLRAALDVPHEGLLVELAITTGLRSGEIRGLVWESIDLEGKRLFVEHQATRRRDDDVTKTENSLRTVPVSAYLIPELKRWKLACPVTARGLVFPGEPNEKGERGPIDADSCSGTSSAAHCAALVCLRCASTTCVTSPAR